MMKLAGAHGHIAAVQWLRTVHDTPWPAVLSDSYGSQLLEWRGPVLAWARAEGCTSPVTEW
jgi:hypothetical protein